MWRTKEGWHSQKKCLIDFNTQVAFPCCVGKPSVWKDLFPHGKVFLSMEGLEQIFHPSPTKSSPLQKTKKSSPLDLFPNLSSFLIGYFVS
jgi:hypothetical protein